MKNIFLKTLVFVLVAAPTLWLTADRASADFHTETYQFLVGTEPLCGLESNACPVISEDHRVGDRIEMTGEGTFRVHPRLATGGGSLTHKDAEGNVIAEGSWTADRLLAFIPYGCGGEELPDNFCGGLTIMQVTLDPGEPGGETFRAILWINCLIGPHPEGQHEGVRLLVPRPFFFFNHEVSGLTLFIKQLSTPQ